MRLVFAVILAGCGAVAPATAPLDPVRHREALVDHRWPKPARLPELPLHLLTITKKPIIVVPPQLGPGGPLAATKAERERLTRIAATTKGTTRLAALDRLADALEDDLAADLDLTVHAKPVVEAYLKLLAEPGFAAYAKADEVLFRAAHLMFELERTAEGNDLVARLLSHTSSRLVGDAHVLAAENATDPVVVRHHLEEALAVARPSLADFIRLRHAEVLTRLGEFAGALVDCEQVGVHSADLREAAAQLCVFAFAEAGTPLNAHTYFTKLDPDSAGSTLRLLARRYLDLGKTDDAINLLEDTLQGATDPEAICTTYAWLLEARQRTGVRPEVLAAARNLAGAAQHAPQCRVDADEAIGELAWTWQVELPKSEADPAQLDTMWQHALAVVTTDGRRAVALRDRAYVLWELASTARRYTRAGWDDAAAALQAAYDAHPDPDLALAIAQAHRNAESLRTSP